MGTSLPCLGGNRLRLYSLQTSHFLQKMSTSRRHKYQYARLLMCAFILLAPRCPAMPSCTACIKGARKATGNTSWHVGSSDGRSGSSLLYSTSLRKYRELY